MAITTANRAKRTPLIRISFIILLCQIISQTQSAQIPLNKNKNPNSFPANMTVCKDFQNPQVELQSGVFLTQPEQGTTMVTEMKIKALSKVTFYSQSFDMYQGQILIMTDSQVLSPPATLDVGEVMAEDYPVTFPQVVPPDSYFGKIKFFETDGTTIGCWDFPLNFVNGNEDDDEIVILE